MDTSINTSNVAQSFSVTASKKDLKDQCKILRDQCQQIQRNTHNVIDGLLHSMTVWFAINNDDFDIEKVPKDLVPSRLLTGPVDVTDKTWLVVVGYNGM